MLESHPLPRLFTLAALSASLLPAQPQTIVSPITAATVDGSASNLAPWGQATARRYLQIHSDLGVGAKLFTKLAFRKDGSAAGSAGTRSVDIELYMGNAVPWNQIRYMLTSNYIGARTNVVARKVVVLGPSSGSGSPAPFDVSIALDAPYVYTGASSLAWEVVHYSGTSSGTFPTAFDIDGGIATNGATTISGPGCVASGQTSAMIHTLTVADVGGAFTLGGYLDYGPANAAAVLYVGSTNPSQAVPGLCGPLYTNLLLALPLGLTDATGYLGGYAGATKYGGGPFAFVMPNTFPGAMLTTQVHALDVSSPNVIPVANSDGRTFTVPAVNTSKVVQVSRAYNDVGGTTGEAAKFSASSYVGYALVTQFTF